MELINIEFTYAKSLELYPTGLHCMDDVWDSEQRNLLTWDRAKDKYPR